MYLLAPLKVKKPVSKVLTGFTTIKWESTPPKPTCIALHQLRTYCATRSARPACKAGLAWAYS